MNEDGPTTLETWVFIEKEGSIIVSPRSRTFSDGNVELSSRIAIVNYQE